MVIKLVLLVNDYTSKQAKTGYQIQQNSFEMQTCISFRKQALKLQNISCEELTANFSPKRAASSRQKTNSNSITSRPERAKTEE